MTRYEVMSAAMVVVVLAGVRGTASTSRAMHPSPAGVGPQTSGAVALTLDDAVTRGLEASHRLAEFEARRDGTMAAVDGRAAADRPVVSLLAGYQRTNHIDEFGVLLPTGERNIIFPDLPNNYRTRLDLRWPIYSGGRVDALERAAEAERRAADEDVMAARADLRLELTRAYWALVTAIDAVRVLDGALVRVDSQLRDVRNFLDVGLIPPNDVLTVEAERARQEVLLIQARSQKEVAEAALRRLIGVAADTPLQPVSPLEATRAPAEQVVGLLGAATDARADRRALRDRLTAAEAVRDAAAAERRPNLAITGGLDYARPNPRFLPREDLWKGSWDAGVNLSWRLWDGGQTDASVAESEARRRAVAERLLEFDSQLELEVRQRALELDAARAAIPAATQSVRSAAEAKRVVDQRFAAGVATSTDALDAQTALLVAELDLTRARASARLAEARLERAVGR